MFTIAVNHVRDTILCPHSDHLSFFFSATASLILLLFLSLPPPRYKVTYSSNHNFLCYQRFKKKKNFRIISKTILHNHSNSIRKLNYDRRKWANTFLFFIFSSCLFFFFLELSCVTSFFFSFHTFFFLFSFGVALFFLLLLFSVLDFSPFSFWGVPNLFFLFLVSFPCFLFSGGLVFFLSLLRSPEQAASK